MTFEKALPGPTLYASETVSTNIIGSVGRTHLRAIAKIAFNYFANFFEPLAFMPQFDRIRRFIRNDEGTGLVNFVQSPLVAGKFRLGGHAVGVQWNPEVELCWAQVTLFNDWHYNVVLGGKGFAISVPITIRGHYFDPVAQSTHTIRPVGRGSVQWHV
jgi:hypothetical protein